MKEVSMITCAICAQLVIIVPRQAQRMILFLAHLVLIGMLLVQVQLNNVGIAPLVISANKVLVMLHLVMLVITALLDQYCRLLVHQDSTALQ
jgi:hypothetical protein